MAAWRNYDNHHIPWVRDTLVLYISKPTRFTEKDEQLTANPTPSAWHGGTPGRLDYDGGKARDWTHDVWTHMLGNWKKSSGSSRDSSPVQMPPGTHRTDHKIYFRSSLRRVNAHQQHKQHPLATTSRPRWQHWPVWSLSQPLDLRRDRAKTGTGRSRDA